MIDRKIIAFILALAAARAAAEWQAPPPSMLKDPSGVTCEGESYWRNKTTREWWPNNRPCDAQCVVGVTTVDGRKAIDCSPEWNRSHGLRVGWKP